MKLPVPEIAVKDAMLFPPMKIGGPIEARVAPVNVCCATGFPPMKIGGPIEATKSG